MAVGAVYNTIIGTLFGASGGYRVFYNRLRLSMIFSGNDISNYGIFTIDALIGCVAVLGASRLGYYSLAFINAVN